VDATVVSQSARTHAGVGIRDGAELVRDWGLRGFDNAMVD
jgi:hypothetical protein